MSNEKKEEKLLVFKGKQYVAVPEELTKGCQGCALINQGCYTNVRAQAICKQGFIFKRKTKEN